jgi:hypothetical protein
VAQQPETYARTISTMSEVIDALNDELTQMEPLLPSPTASRPSGHGCGR